MRRFVTACVLGCALSCTLQADDWPQFLGPSRNGSSQWSVPAWKDAPKVLWKQPVGEAHSSPVVADGIVYAFYQMKGKNADALAAFDAKSGELKWEKSYDRAEFKPLFGNGPRSTPAISNGRVFTLGGTGILACWDAKSGKIVWKVDTLKEFKAPNLFFGISTSPVVLGDTVVIMVGGKGAGLVGFDVKSGKTTWQSTDDPSSYASPVFINKQIITLTGANLLGLTDGGEKRWSYPFKDKLNESSTTPLVVGDLVIGSSVTAGTVCVRLTRDADGNTKAEKAWENRSLTCYFSTPVVVGEHLYMVNGAATLTNASITLRCVELKTGKIAWEKKNVGKYHAAIIRCGNVNPALLMLDDNGFLTLFESNVKEYKESARTKVCGKTWAHPALIAGHLYVRDDNELFCVQLDTIGVDR